MSVFLKIGLLTTAILILFVVFLFYVIMPKSIEVSEKHPFKQFVNKTLASTQTAYLYQQVKHRSTLSSYILFSEKQNDSQLSFIEELPEGSTITLNKVIILTNGVSGAQHCICNLSIHSTQLHKTIQAEYYWGEHHAICLEEPCNYWVFPKALWQTEADNSKHFLK
jgi:hypothetical protein